MARKAAIHFVRPLRRRILSTSSRGRSFFTLHKEAEMGRAEPVDGGRGGWEGVAVGEVGADKGEADKKFGIN